MGVTLLITVLVWLLIGFVWTRFWYNNILDNHRFNDTGHEPGPVFLVLMTIFGPAFCLIAGLMIACEFLSEKTGPTIKKIYGG